MARGWTSIAVVVILCGAAESAWASFPGRNGTIAYSWVGHSAYRAGPTETSIRAVHPRTGVVRTLRDCPLRTNAGVPYTDCSVAAPSYAPGGATLAFPITLITPDFTGQPWRFEPGLATMPSDGSSSDEHATEHRYTAVSWSPAGDRLLLERPLSETGSTRGNGVFLASLDRTELSQVAPDLSQGADWSSRGEIAFGRNRDTSCFPGCEDIFLTRVGGTPRRLTHRGGWGPSWSPHGTKLAFTRRSRGQTNIYIVRRNGHGLRQLTRRGGYNPVWSPDGNWIAFIRDGDLHVIRPTGRDRRRLVDSPATQGEGPQATSVDWQARPRR